MRLDLRHPPGPIPPRNEEPLLDGVSKNDLHLWIYSVLSTLKLKTSYLNLIGVLNNQTHINGSL